MLEINGNHIARLNDEDLRILVARLCEAELCRCGLPLSAVTAGGDQNAADGGIDVRVQLSTDAISSDFIPKPVTGFQVKCSDMPTNAIKSEMRPKDVLRLSIRELAIANGAYVIVSSKGSTADKALRNRRDVMRQAISDLPDTANLHLDFYDRDRLARWVRCYPSVELWLRERIGEPLSGWRAYGNWAFGDPADSEYLFDDKGRIISRYARNQGTMSIEQGIAAMRNILAAPGGIVRLVGLSGMGKTRLVQALFDNRVGYDALDRSLVAYTDQSYDSCPSARDMLYRLAASSLRAIVVVDNCNPETHRVLTQTVRANSSKLSLITVEYDIADDEPEETQVFHLDPASQQVVEKIIKRLKPLVTQLDRYRIAEFSGGNARIALALARTVENQEHLGGFNDDDLFKRLFHQRRESSESLMRAAEACALVYSFDGETLEEATAELPILAELAKLSVTQLYGYVEDLRSRDLVQRRSRWRAILPHAIANRLARQALQRIPSDTIVQTFSKRGRKRLLKSFSRRLGYLHDCESAQIIAKSWLTSTDWLANPAQLNELGITLFQNIAPTAPEKILDVIETAVLCEGGQAFISIESSNRWVWTTLLRSIAYDPDLFARATFLLARFLAVEPHDFKHNSTRSIINGLFHVYLSGTHAVSKQRLAVIRRLLESEDPALQQYAIEALGTMLETEHFHASYSLSFGARSRDYGWQPRTQDELADWYRATIRFARGIVFSESPLGSRVKEIIAKSFRGLWVKAFIYDELENLVKDLAAQDGWPDGWIAVRTTIRFHINRMPPAAASRLRLLELELYPNELTQKVRAYVMSRFDYLTLLDGEADKNNTEAYQSAWDRFCQIVKELGKEVAVTPEVLTRLLPQLLRNGLGQHWQFGGGLAQGAHDLAATWQQFYDVLISVPEQDRNISLMVGFIEAASHRDPDTANRLLDEAITDPILGPYFPLLQASTQIDEAGAERLVSSLANSHVKAWTYQYLCYGGVANTIPVSVFKRIVLGVADLPDGLRIAVDLFSMHLYFMKSAKLDITAEMTSIGRGLLSRWWFQKPVDNLEYHLNEIAATCLQGDDAYGDALNICANLDRALCEYRFSMWPYGILVRTLFQIQPEAALKAFFNGNREIEHHYRLSSIFSIDEESPVNSAPPEILLAWATEDPATRIPILAEEIQLFNNNGDQQMLAWSPLALSFLELAPDRVVVLDIFGSRIYPSSWSGSLADVLISYIPLVEQLKNHYDNKVVAWARAKEISLEKRIEKEREHDRDRYVEDSFE